MAYEAEREALKAVYKSRAWRAKVNKMPDQQVIAIYLNLKSQKKVA